MEKDFDSWNQQKKALDENKRDLLFKEGEVWWCALGLNVGEEVYGKGREFMRPVFVLKKFTRNTCLILPVTTRDHVGSWFYRLALDEKEVWLMLHQCRFISANRLLERQYDVPEEQFIKIKRTLGSLLELF